MGKEISKIDRAVRLCVILAGTALFGIFVYVIWGWVPRGDIRLTLLGLWIAAGLLFLFWQMWQRRQLCDFADELCRTLDDLMEDRKPEVYFPYEDTLTARIQGKFLQYYDLMSEGRRQSRQDKQIIQELVSDISHQVKTPIANLQMFMGILKSHSLSEEKRIEFLDTMEGQINKLDFLLQSLIKMSRLETGTFALHVEKTSLYDTIALALNGIWERAEDKDISLSVECDHDVTARHDVKWTAEALGNILDNAVKYTRRGGSIQISVRPWQFYTRVDIKDTGMGIPKEQYNEVFKRFWRSEEAAWQEGVGLGLYLAKEIVTRQRGYISVKSDVGKGTTFSVYLLT